MFRGYNCPSLFIACARTWRVWEWSLLDNTHSNEVMLEISAGFPQKEHSVGNTSLSPCHRNPPGFMLGTFKLRYHQKPRGTCQSCRDWAWCSRCKEKHSKYIVPCFHLMWCDRLIQCSKSKVVLKCDGMVYGFSGLLFLVAFPCEGKGVFGEIGRQTPKKYISKYHSSSVLLSQSLTRSLPLSPP